MVLTPLLGEAAMASWPRWRRMATVFEPIRPVQPMTTIFMGLTSVVDDGSPQMDLNEPPRMSRRSHLIRLIAIFMADPEGGFRVRWLPNNLAAKSSFLVSRRHFI